MRTSSAILMWRGTAREKKVICNLRSICNQQRRGNAQKNEEIVRAEIMAGRAEWGETGLEVSDRRSTSHNTKSPSRSEDLCILSANRMAHSIKAIPEMTNSAHVWSPQHKNIVNPIVDITCRLYAIQPNQKSINRSLKTKVQHSHKRAQNSSSSRG